MEKYYKIRFVKDSAQSKIGEETLASRDNAEWFVAAGVAEYVDDRPPKDNLIMIDSKEYESLKKEFPSMIWEKELEMIIEGCNLKPFRKHSVKKFLNSIKRQVTLINESIPKELPNSEVEISIREMKESENPETKKAFGDFISVFVDKIHMAEQFIERVPIFYDKSKIWWIWDKNLFKWNRCDETDIMILIADNVRISTIDSKEKNEIIESLKQVGRRKHPLPIKKTWVQYKENIYDIIERKVLKATPKYWVVNPIDWDVGENENTPVMDSLFEQWVGKEYRDVLYEIIAFCTIPQYPIHRAFCFIGRGRNGKGCYLRLIQKFLGMHNVTSSRLDLLVNNKFENFKLWKKLACFFGETNFKELSDTDTFKKLTGEDILSFEKKFAEPIDDYNYAKLLIATNSLPESTDKTDGFYSRWMIIDFPNQFDETKDVLNTIPDVEYQNLARKCIRIIEELIVNRKFTREGTILERAKKYEDKSNPLQKFLYESTVKDPSTHIFKWEFKNRFIEWLKDHGHRVISDTELGIKMKGMYEDDKITSIDGKRWWAWAGLKWKTQLSDFN